MRHVATISSKGQMVIPARLRKELGLKADAQVRVTKKGNELIITPRNFDAVLALCGKFAGTGMEKDLIEDKRKERKREERKLEVS